MDYNLNMWPKVLKNSLPTLRQSPQPSTDPRTITSPTMQAAGAELLVQRLVRARVARGIPPVDTAWWHRRLHWQPREAVSGGELDHHRLPRGAHCDLPDIAHIAAVCQSSQANWRAQPPHLHPIGLRVAQVHAQDACNKAQQSCKEPSRNDGSRHAPQATAASARCPCRLCKGLCNGSGVPQQYTHPVMRMICGVRLLCEGLPFQNIVATQSGGRSTQAAQIVAGTGDHNNGTVHVLVPTSCPQMPVLMRLRLPPERLRDEISGL